MPGPLLSWRLAHFYLGAYKRWLDWLRDGSEADKIAARRGLAGVFEQRGMLEEAIELLESNVKAVMRGAETLH